MTIAQQFTELLDGDEGYADPKLRETVKRMFFAGFIAALESMDRAGELSDDEALAELERWHNEGLEYFRECLGKLQPATGYEPAAKEPAVG